MYDPIPEPVVAVEVKPVVEELTPVETTVIAAEPSKEEPAKCLCEKARGWLEESIRNPINYHQDEVYDYGSKALRDVGDDERYYEEVKSRCECRKRRAGSASNSSSSNVSQDEVDLKSTPEDLEVAKRARMENVN